MDEARDLADLESRRRAVEREISTIATSFARERARRDADWRNARASVAKVVHSNLDRIKARLWRPDGRLVATQMELATRAPSGPGEGRPTRI